MKEFCTKSVIQLSMIITCPCEKQFKINSSLIPNEGRERNVDHVKEFGFTNHQMKVKLH